MTRSEGPGDRSAEGCDPRVESGPEWALRAIARRVAGGPIPGGASWSSVFGAMTLGLFVLLAMTGMYLAIYYAPTPDRAYEDIESIITGVPLGTVIRRLHHWGASAMVVALCLHLLQVFLAGAYKPPREALWVGGVVLLLITLASAFTGALLPWDQNAYWVTDAGLTMIGSVPLVGEFLAGLLRGGESVGASTLSRFFAFHLLFLPALLVLGVLLHLFLLKGVGLVGPEIDGRVERVREPFYRRQAVMDAVAMLIVLSVLTVLALTVPVPLSEPANPSGTGFTPVPEWYFLPFYQVPKYVHGPLESHVSWALPTLLFLVLLGWPWLARARVRHPAARPVVLASSVAFLLAIVALLRIDLQDLYALPHADLSVARGKVLVARYGCTACHRIHGEGGVVGPDLSDEGNRRPDPAWHYRHFRDPQSVSPGSIMEKFPLTDQEIHALTSYVLSLKKSGPCP